MVCILKIPLKELGRRRETRIPGFMKNYVYSEYWKSILRILLIKNNNLITSEYKNVLFLNIDKKTYSYLNNIREYDSNKAKKWNTQKKNIFNLFAIYFPNLLKPFLKKYEKVIFSTDINIANHNILKELHSRKLKVCVQHGYFPVSHAGDLDGLNADIYIVRSEAQKKILLDEGFSGKFLIKKVNSKNFTDNDLITGLVIVGPGFRHNSEAENVIFEIARLAKNNFSKTIFFRPHPRCSNSLKNKILSLGIKIDKSNLTDVDCPNRNIFIGIKSTMLLDAQEIGHKSILVEHPSAPKFFPPGEINIVTNISELDKIL